MHTDESPPPGDAAAAANAADAAVAAAATAAAAADAAATAAALMPRLLCGYLCAPSRRPAHLTRCHQEHNYERHLKRAALALFAMVSLFSAAWHLSNFPPQARSEYHDDINAMSL